MSFLIFRFSIQILSCTRINKTDKLTGCSKSRVFFTRAPAGKSDVWQVLKMCVCARREFVGVSDTVRSNNLMPNVVF